MAYVAVDSIGREYIFSDAQQILRKQYSAHSGWIGHGVELPKGLIKKLIGRDLTWDDDPVELK